MAWYSTAEICEILSRFDNIYLVGDSMMRRLQLVFDVLLREDFVDGMRQTWLDRAAEAAGSLTPDGDAAPPASNCTCRDAYNRSCFWQMAADTQWIWDKDRGSIKCSTRPAAVSSESQPSCAAPIVPECVVPGNQATDDDRRERGGERCHRGD